MWVPYFFGRQTLRLRDYDYATPGAYFVTVTTHNRRQLLGEIRDAMVLSEAGTMVQAIWRSLPARFANVGLDSMVIMPDHLHGILMLADEPRIPLGQIVGALKSLTTFEYSRGVHAFGWPSFEGKLWERNYYEHVIRNDKELAEVREYIANNVAAWKAKHL